MAGHFLGALNLRSDRPFHVHELQGFWWYFRPQIQSRLPGLERSCHVRS